MEEPQMDMSWRTTDLRMKIIAQIEEAMRASNNLSKPGAELEEQIFHKINTMADYLFLIAKVICHLKGIREGVPNLNANGVALVLNQAGGVSMVHDPMGALKVLINFVHQSADKEINKLISSELIPSASTDLTSSSLHPTTTPSSNVVGKCKSRKRLREPSHESLSACVHTEADHRLARLDESALQQRELHALRLQAAQFNLEEAKAKKETAEFKKELARLEIEKCKLEMIKIQKDVHI